MSKEKPFSFPFPIPNLIMFAGMVILSLPIYAISLLNMFWPVDPKKQKVDIFTRMWMRSILWSTGTRVPANLKDKLPSEGPFIFMSNHQSHIDVVLLYAKLPVTPKFVAKKELLYIPVFGFTMWCLGHITIDRRNRQKAIESLDRAGQKIRNGLHVLIFPEGTRMKGDPNFVGDFKKGGFMLAIKSGVPILPVGLAGTADRLPKGSFISKPGYACYRIGDPIETKDLKDSDRDQLMQTTREAIAELKKQAHDDLVEFEGQISA